jgi:hypothetical protein
MLLPVLVAILAAKAFTDTIEPTSYYHAVMESSRMPFLPPEPHSHVDLDLATVRLVMADPVQTVRRVIKLSEVDNILRSTSHNGFPVVQPAAEGLVCLGLIARKHLLVRLACLSPVPGLLLRLCTWSQAALTVVLWWCSVAPGGMRGRRHHARCQPILSGAEPSRGGSAGALIACARLAPQQRLVAHWARGSATVNAGPRARPDTVRSSSTHLDAV